jgi:hypothetical protein
MIFVFSALQPLLDLLNDIDLRIDFKTLADFLLGKEKAIVLKPFSVVGEPEEIEDFYLRIRPALLSGILESTDFDAPPPREVVTGGGIFRDEEKWVLYLPLEV